MDGVPPRSRTVRGARVARFAGEEAMRRMGTRTANLTRGPEARRAAVEQHHLDAADRLLTMLGSLKGGAMKIGQMLSLVDLGFVPARDREAFRGKLAALRDSAPVVPFPRMRAVVEAETGGPLARSFASFSEEPLGAASIGQVYAAETRDGRPVAVKVQYPRIQAAVRADMKNLRLFGRVARGTFPGLDVDALLAEISDRVIEELDYRLEAAHQTEAAAQFRGHPFVVVPEVVAELSTERVLVTERVEGRKFDELVGADAATRDRLGEIIHRFYCGAMYRSGAFSADPHPGNLMLQADGRVAFFDFGLYKHLPDEVVEFELDCERAAAAEDAEELHALMSGAGILPEPDAVTAEEVLDYVHDVIGWYLVDAEVTITRQIAGRAMMAAVDPRSKHFATLRDQHLPAAHLFARRAELQTMAILGELRATANWHRIASEWLYGEPPVTELGRMEEDFWARRRS